MLNTNIGNSGKYFVAGELELRGYTVAFPMSNVKEFDILAIDRKTHNQVAIQVKTKQNKQKKWILSKKNEELIGDNIFYIFVSFDETDIPEYHTVPSKIVAKTIKEAHKKWIETPGKKGQSHNDTTIREFFDNDNFYEDRWELLRYKTIDDKSQSLHIYDSLISFIPRLKGIEYAKCYPEHQTGDGSKENPFIMPYYRYNDVVEEFQQEVYEFQRKHLEYQLDTYINILIMNDLGWDEKVMLNADVSRLNGQAVMALILGAIRAERFCDGALKFFLESGCIEKWLLRLQEISASK